MQRKKNLKIKLKKKKEISEAKELELELNWAELKSSSTEPFRVSEQPKQKRIESKK